MKLRIRSMATNDTQRITISDTASLTDLKTLIASTPSISSSNPNPNSIHLSLNRSEDLFSLNPTVSLKELGLTTGDLLFFSLSPFPPNPSQPMEIDVKLKPTVINTSPNTPHLIPQSLVKLMELEGNCDTGILSQLIRITHAALLDMGFILHNGNDFNLPQNWPSQASTLDFKYATSELNDKVAILRFSLEGNYATIYGYFTGETDFYRVCFDLGKCATLLTLNLKSMSENDQKEFLEIFRVLKDGISLPLMMDLCMKNNLPLPPCFMRLSTDIKSKILDTITGADVARLGSTCKELRNLSLDEDLWKEKVEEEFGNDSGDVAVTSAREKYKRAYIAAKSKEKYNANVNIWRRGGRGWRGGIWIGGAPRPGLGFLGGDYDRYPVIGERFRVRQVSPSCHFGSAWPFARR